MHGCILVFCIFTYKRRGSWFYTATKINYGHTNSLLYRAIHPNFIYSQHMENLLYQSHEELCQLYIQLYITAGNNTFSGKNKCIVFHICIHNNIVFKCDILLNYVMKISRFGLGYFLNISIISNQKITVERCE